MNEQKKVMKANREVKVYSITKHAMARINERFPMTKKEDLIDDMKNHWKFIRRVDQGQVPMKFQVNGQLGRYILAKEGSRYTLVTAMLYNTEEINFTL